jgi:hypothetical protein
MRLTRLRTGELIALLGALALLVSLFLPWFATDGFYRRIEDPSPALDAIAIGLPAAPSGWSSLGWLALVPLVLAIAAALSLVVATVTERDSAAIPVAIGVITVPLGVLATLVTSVRLLAEPGFGVGLTDAEVDVRLPAFLGLAGAVAILVGAWRALADERTHTAEARAQTERALSVRGEPRPVPPPPDHSS